MQILSHRNQPASFVDLDSSNELLALKKGTGEWNRWRQNNAESWPDLLGANLRGAELSGMNLKRANLKTANLRGADLRGANLSEADLSGADLREANLADADLSGANLSGANLGSANFNHATLREVHLSGAIGLTQAQVNLATGDALTFMPEGVRRPPHWLKHGPLN
jgi:uncharacterized protein YjbI with pentapeptide repeats